MSEANAFIHHIGITAPAEVLEEVVSFYGKVLDLKPGYRPDFGGIGGYWLYLGDHPMIHLLEDPNRQGDKSGFFDHVAFRCTGLQQMILNLENNDIDFFRFETKETNQVQLFINDPSGTTVELNYYEP